MINIKKSWIFAAIFIFSLFLYTKKANGQLSIQAELIDKNISNLDEIHGKINVGYTDYNSDFDLELWNKIAQKSKIEFKLIKYDQLGSLLDDVKKNKIHVGMGGISITPLREESTDFSKPYLNTGLKIAIKDEHTEPGFFEALTDTTFIKSFIKSMTSPEVKVIAFWFFIFTILMAHIIWLAERDSFKKKNELESGELSESYFKGIGEAIYFCLVTSSTVGYGDFTCKRIIGRISSAVVIVTGVAFFANLTGYIAAERAVEIVSQSKISSFNDLTNKKVATKAGVSTSKDRLIEVGAIIKEIDGKDWLEQAKKMLKNGSVDAIVRDSPEIDRIQDPDIKKIDSIYYPQYYGFCLQENSNIEEAINVSLLEIMDSNEYSDLIKKHYNR